MNSLPHQNPELTDLPNWINWLAQDADGTWWGYEAIPNEQHNGWYENGVGCYVRLRRDEANTDWLNSLRRVGLGSDFWPVNVDKFLSVNLSAVIFYNFA